jgi:thioester reductase-like protein
VRASDDADGRRRLATQFDVCGLGSERLQSRVLPVVGDLALPGLGLSAAAFAALADGIDVVYHVGALVNFAYPYSALRAANVDGTREVLRLACAPRPKPLHYVSTLGVLGNGAAREADGKLVECDVPDRYDGVPIGYFESKWVAERLVATARARGLPVSIFRPGIIGGDTQYGRSPATDLLAQLIQLIARLRSAPDVEFALDIAPVDYVARAIVHVSRRPEAMGRTFHVCGAGPTRFADLAAWIEACGSPLRRLPLAAGWTNLRRLRPNGCHWPRSSTSRPPTVCRPTMTAT